MPKIIFLAIINLICPKHFSHFNCTVFFIHEKENFVSNFVSKRVLAEESQRQFIVATKHLIGCRAELWLRRGEQDRNAHFYNF